jgi:uncharacterized protein YdcH (DUF465 family)
MSVSLIEFKRKQLATLKAREEQCESTVAAIAGIESEIRGLEGTPDNPQDAELVELRARVTELRDDLTNEREKHAITRDKLAAVTVKAATAKKRKKG